MAIRIVVLVGLLFAEIGIVYGQASRVLEWQGQAGMNGLRIFDEPCADPDTIKHIVRLVPPEFHSKFQRSSLRYDGVTYAGCWIAHNGVIVNLDEKGDFLQPVPTHFFKDKTI